MTKPPSPFAGVKLSDLVSNPSPGPLDQQLFGPPPPMRTSTPAQQEAPQRHKDVKTERPQGTKMSSRQDTKTPFRQDVITPRQKDVNVSRQQAVRSYDINDETFERETVRLAKAEQRAVEQLKLSLRELLDSTVGKNDIFRAGLHFILDDFRRNGEQSEIVSRLRAKTK